MSNLIRMYLKDIRAMVERFDKTYGDTLERETTEFKNGLKLEVVR